MVNTGKIPFEPAHEWTHRGDLTKRDDGVHISADCPCGCTVWATVRAAKVREWKTTGGDTRICPYTGRNHR